MSDKYLEFNEIPCIAKWGSLRPFFYDSKSGKMIPSKCLMIVNLDLVSHIIEDANDGLLRVIINNDEANPLRGRFVK